MAKSLRQRMQDGEVLTAMRGSLSTSKAELAAMWTTGRYDYIWIDSQHTPYSDQLLVDYCQAAGELGIDVQLRIPHTRQAHMVGRFLDFGLTAVLVPEVEEPETVDDAIAYAYYGPIGRRSWGGPTRKGFSQGVDRHEYSAWWNDTVVLGIQVESVEAVTNIHKLAKPGVSVVTFGPNDLSFSLEAHPGFPLQDVDACMRNVAAQLKDTGIRLAMGTATQPEERDKYVDMGFTLFQDNMPD
ncbi:MAG: aldolase/citrate lyase family protein [Candidatus Latescibacteria bacterium]|jgi:2-keto-3-deoxy-L-rhamnonate aldolase RhmA|nr:aldolase/citrate lyase family protein [Candidatus Latescibacterota bacterium]